MKILTVHNTYQLPGGEDEVFASERDMLRSAGHEVVEYVRSNDEISDYGLWNKATLSLRTVWAWDSVKELRALLRLERSRNWLTFHNTFPLDLSGLYTRLVKKLEYPWFNPCTILGSSALRRPFIAMGTSVRIA